MEDDILTPPEDSPAVRAEMRSQAQHLAHVLLPTITAFAAAADAMSTSLQGVMLNPHHVSQLPLTPNDLKRLDAQEIFTQLTDFTENLQHQLRNLVVEPLNEYKQMIDGALSQTRAFDEESDALDSAALKYLSLSRDSPVETRAHVAQDLNDKAAGVALHFFDARTSLRHACESQRHVPHKALGELLVAQLAYHQSCARLLTEAMPQVSELLSSTDATKLALQAERDGAALVRQAMPRPQVREGGTLAEGWLFKASFNLDSEVDAVKGQLNRFKPWNKRWFVLCDDGKLYYYKSPDDSRTAKVPIDMLMLNMVTPVNGPLEFELHLGPRTLRLKATDTAERQRWMMALTSYIASHTEERTKAQARYLKLYTPQGTGVRDLDANIHASEHASMQGYLYRQDMDIMRRWRKWWCEVDDGKLTCTLYESLRLVDPNRDRKAQAAVKVASTRTQQEGLEQQIQVEPFRIAQSVSLPLATVTVREARHLSIPFVFEVISPREAVILQAQSQEQMQQWTAVIQNVTASLLGCSRTVYTSAGSMDGTVFGRVRQTVGNTACADCGASQPPPAWASINLGALLCLTCAGIHRQMGVHISKVRSLELDTKEWSEPLISMMLQLGNAAVNSIWFKEPADASGRAVQITADASSAQREAFIRQKYVARAFLASSRPPPGALHTAALTDDVVTAATCVAHGESVEESAPAAAVGVWAADAAAAHSGRTALHIAAAVGNEAVLEFLLQNRAKVDAEDPKGRTPLLLAVLAGQVSCVVQLVTRGANISHADHEHVTPMVAAESPGLEAILQAMLSYKLAQDEKLLAQLGDDVVE